MSIESARAFVGKVSKDDVFRKQLSSCKNRDEQQRFAKAAGFDFTGDEIKTAQSEIQDADLDQVSGAGCCLCEMDCCEVEP